jgi:hypothetical protein
MEMQEIDIEMKKGRKICCKRVSVPANDEMIKIAVRLHSECNGNEARERFEGGIATYWPEHNYTESTIDPFTGKTIDPPHVGGSNPATCLFGVEEHAFSVAQVVFESGVPILQFDTRCKEKDDAIQTTGQQQSLFGPDSLADDACGIEGGVVSTDLTRYERDRHLRQEAIRIHGTKCVICGFDFRNTYGNVANGFIHIHHLEALADVGERHKVNPKTDMLPVCPNCHAVIHMKKPPYTIEEVREMIDRLPV